MELKIKDVELPKQITFNYQELKTELQEKVKHYETLVYTDEQIKEAKADRSNLNKLKKALNDERIKREREYMTPFNDFKAKINEIISIIDKPVQVIDTQIKGYEDKLREEKLEAIKEYYNSIEDNVSWLQLNTIFNNKWLNASTSMKSIQEEISSKIEQVKSEIDTLSNLPEFGFEATEIYKSTLDINKAISEGKRLAEISKKRAEMEAEKKAREEEQERLRAEEELKRQEEPATPTEGVITIEEPKEQVTEVDRQWVSFSALLSTEEALALKEFFDSRNIMFKRA